jgi:hypothetical protein
MDEMETSARGADGLLRRAWLRLLDGKRPWGAIDVLPDRFGVTRYRLMVYRPDITESERRWVRVAHASPVWGVALWISLQVWLSGTASPWIALLISTGMSVGAGAVAAALAGTARTEVRILSAIVMADFDDSASARVRARIERLAMELLEADERRSQGRISTVEHELTWWRVYNEMAPGRSPAAA